MSVTITTFGVLHGDEPSASNPVRIDLTTALRNPADDPALIELTGLDARVRDHVMTTPGADVIRDQALADIEEALKEGDVDVLVYCRGGRHRSVAMGEELHDALVGRGVVVKIVHRDVEKPVVR
ncbi:hypothetical protein KGD82_13790 [Nocardiopsis eucommiae]|uniref:RapZ C-terminal domain-containing protein n=1 Tax=Nocardiopsis eucommiae TaxID=2831970 RepID=A0A975LD59_9ACTN|nr:hypothetical protein KGD82_13790 [Nocardiopsis eucommiae]